jgi:hypothetical protein
VIPALDWYAPPLHGGEHGLGSWSEADIAALLRTGVSPRGTSLGPMSESSGAACSIWTMRTSRPWRST